MDIYINTSKDSIDTILRKQQFSTTRKKNHFSAMLYVQGGRYHFMYTVLNDLLFCDFHFDNTLHGIGMGADYGKKPESYFKHHLEASLRSLDAKLRILHVNWFTRRNKAIITGMRL